MSNAAVTAERDVSVPSFKVCAAWVTAVQRLSPSLVRISVGGPELAGMTSGGLDQRIKLLLPGPGQACPALPEEPTFSAVRRMPEAVRPIARTYTLRAHRPEHNEFDVDVVLHGDSGPGSAFASRARPGRSVGVVVPNAEFPHGDPVGGVEFRTALLARSALLVGDETSLPAVGSILGALPAGVGARVLLEVPHRADAQWLATAAHAEVTWLPRESSQAGRGRGLLEVLRSSGLVTSGLYAWVGGEAGMVRAVRRHLVDERGLARNAVSFMGYWRQGRSEDTALRG